MAAVWPVFGLGAVTANLPASQDFGQLAVNPGSPALVSLTTSFSGLSGNPKFSLAYAVDFSLGAANCTTSGTITCSLPVTFKPRNLGLRLDAVLVSDQNGNALGSVLLHGIGQSAQIAMYPGTLTTFAGTGSLGYSGDGGLATKATFFNPAGLAIDQLGNLYIADAANNVVRKVSASSGIVTTVAGNGFPGFFGDGGPAARAALQNPVGLALDGAGNLYIADQGNNRIRKVTTAGVISTVAGGGSVASQADGLGDGGPATSAILYGPNDVAVDTAGNLYIADSYNGLVREVNSGTSIISMVAGGGSGGLGDGSPATAAKLDNPCGLALDTAGNLYIADSGHSRVRVVSASSGTITTVAGNGRYGYSGDLGPASSASLSNPVAVRTDAAGNVYIADAAINFIRVVQSSNGVISSLTNTSIGGAANANPWGLALDSRGNVYVASTSNNTITEITPSPQPVSFGTVNVGQKSTLFPVTELNVGNMALSFTSITLTAGFSQQSSGYTDCSVSAALVFGGSCQIAVAYVPSANGGAIGALSISSNSLSGSTETVALSGTGGTGAVPQVSIGPAALSFGAITIGSTSAVSVLTLSNTGTAALSILGTSISGLNAADFNTSATTCGSSLAANASCTISLTFSPRAAGSRNATLTITDSIASSPQSIPLTGTGMTAMPGASLSVSSLNFGNVSVGSVGTAQSVSLSNQGSATLLIAGIQVTGANASDFSMSSTCGSSLPINSSCNISIVFSPSAGGSRTGMLDISDSAPGASQIVSLSGAGVLNPAASVGPASIGFNTQAVGTTSQAKAVQFSNTGNTGLSISSVAVSGANASDFEIVNNCPATLAVAGNCAVAVSFKPSAIGSRAAMLTFMSSAASSPQSVALSGTGAPAPAITLNVTNLPFGTIPLGANGTQIVAVSNSGSVALQINSTTLSGSNPDQFAIVGNSCATNLPPSGYCSIAIQFSPGLLGNQSAVLNVSVSSTSAVSSVSLTGTGVRPFAFHSGNKALQAVFRPWNASWWTSFGPESGYTWGTSGDLPAPADFDGDHQDDFAVFRPATGSWLIELSGNPGAFISQQWGQSGDVPVAADYDGDGKADLAIWRPSSGTWLIQLSSNPGAFISQTWGSFGDIPVTGDYDGDGKADIAIWQPASGGWWIIPSSAPDTVITEFWGQAGDVPVPGDYDGDGKTDFAVWRPSTGDWLILPSSRPGSIISEQLGRPGDIPVPGDYDGNGKTVPAVWRPYVGYVFTTNAHSEPAGALASAWVLPGEIP